MISNRKRKTKFKPVTDGVPSIPDLGGCLFHTTAKGLWVKLLLSREKRCIGRTNCWNMWRGQRLRPRETNVSPQKRDYFNRKYIFQSLIFRGHSFVLGCFFFRYFPEMEVVKVCNWNPPGFVLITPVLDHTAFIWYFQFGLSLGTGMVGMLLDLVKPWKGKLTTRTTIKALKTLHGCFQK